MLSRRRQQNILANAAFTPGYMYPGRTSNVYPDTYNYVDGYKLHVRILGGKITTVFNYVTVQSTCIPLYLATDG